MSKKHDKMRQARIWPENVPFLARWRKMSDCPVSFNSAVNMAIAKYREIWSKEEKEKP